MKKFSFLALMLLLGIFLSACTEDELESEADTAPILEGVVTAESNEAEESDTRQIPLLEENEAVQGENEATSQVTILTMGGWLFSSEARAKVNDFNQENTLYQIELINFSAQYAEGELPDFSLEGAPDILYGEMARSMASPNMFVDLWPFIDADSQINREDFFQNILEASQFYDGRLPVISSTFYIQTVRALSTLASDLDTWTIADLYAMVERGFEDEKVYPLGVHTSVPSMLFFLLFYSGTDFIDLETGVSHLDSQEFYDALQFLLLLSNNEPSEFPHFPTNEYRLRSGDHLLNVAPLWSVDDFTRFVTMMEGESFTFLGMPSSEGGIHGAGFFNPIGITVHSEHPDVAWTFLRQFFLPDAMLGEVHFRGIPIRTDLFENDIERFMTVEFTTYGSDGEEMGLRFESITIDGEGVSVRPLTPEKADSLRILIESISHAPLLDYEVLSIVLEELEPFLAGERSACVTATIMQVRVQLHLDTRLW